MLAENDVCNVCVDWADDDVVGKRVQIVGTQKNGKETFYKVLWRGLQSRELRQKYGNLFTERELRKIEKKKS
jgi:hypothetical protein